MIIGGFVSLINDDKAEIVDWGKKSRAGTDNNVRLGGIKKFFPNKVTLGFGLTGVNKSDMLAKSGTKDRNELGSEGDFWNEENSRLTAGKGIIG